MLQLIAAAVSAVDNETPVQDFKGPFSYAYYLVILGYKLSPVILAAFVISLAAFARQLRFRKSEQGWNILAYLFIFWLILTLASKKIDRYSLALIPPLILFMSVYLAKVKIKYLAIIIAAQLLVLGHFYVTHFPALSGYYSPILGGTQSALNLHVYDNSGEHFAQAAYYLNNKSRSDIYIPNNLEAFRYFYEGSSMSAFATSVGYVVTSVDFDRKSSPVINECSTLEKSFGPKDSTPVVFIYRCPVFPLTR